jgi:hypothetical protein
MLNRAQRRAALRAIGHRLQQQQRRAARAAQHRAAQLRERERAHLRRILAVQGEDPPPPGWVDPYLTPEAA